MNLPGTSPPDAIYANINSAGSGRGITAELVWWSGVLVSALASINSVNLRRAHLVLRWATVSRFNSQCRAFRYVTNQPPKANSAFHPSEVDKWVTSSAGKANAGLVHSISGFTRGVQVKLWDPLRTRAIPERLRGFFHDEALYKSKFTFTLTLLNGRVANSVRRKYGTSLPFPSAFPPSIFPFPSLPLLSPLPSPVP